MKELIMILKSGTKTIGKYEEDEYEDICNAWDDGTGRLCFRNCEVLVSEVAVFQWES